MMMTYEFRPVEYQGGANPDAAIDALRLLRMRNRHATSISRHSATLPIPDPGRRRKDDFQQKAFQEVFEASRQRFLTLAHTIVRNAEDAEDALQNAYLSGYLNLRGFEGRSALTTWFTRIVVNAALMVRRKRGQSRVVTFPETNMPHECNWTERIASSQPDPEATHAAQETLRLVNERLVNLKPSLRQAFIMIHFEDLSIGEACAHLGISRSAFKARLLRARRQLAQRVPRVVVAPIHRQKLVVRSRRPSFMGTSSS